MSKTIVLSDALAKGVVRLGDYFVTTVAKDRYVTTMERETGFGGSQQFKIRAGTSKLWRLDKDFRMLGEPTEEGLTLQGKVGFMQSVNTIQRVAKELFDSPNIFEQVRACSFQKEKYMLSEKPKIFKEEGKKYQHPDDKKLYYWLASQCEDLDGRNEGFYTFLVGNGYIIIYYMYDTRGYENSATFAVRPEATAKTTLILETEYRDGTKNNPWKCVC